MKCMLKIEVFRLQFFLVIEALILLSKKGQLSVRSNKTTGPMLKK